MDDQRFDHPDDDFADETLPDVDAVDAEFESCEPPQDEALADFDAVDATFDAWEPAQNERPEVRWPVELSRVERAEAKRLVADALVLAGGLVRDVDGFSFGKMVDVVIDSVGDGTAGGIVGRGLALRGLVERAHVGRGRLRERFSGDLHVFSELAIRAIAAMADRPALYEQLSSVEVDVGRRHNGMGTDRSTHESQSSALWQFVAASGMSDRHCPVSARPLLTGTRDDHSSSRADAKRIAEWTKKLGERPVPTLGEQGDGVVKAHACRRPAGTLGEHVYEVLAEQQRVRRLANDAVKNRPELFSPSLSKERFGRAFAVRLLMGETPHGGQPESEHRSATGVLLPGRDPDVVDAVATAGRMGVLFYGTPRDRSEFAAADFEPLRVGRLPRTYELGITVAANTRYSYSAKRRQLARVVVGNGIRVDLWQLVRFDERHLLSAVALIERHVQAAWTAACLRRWNQDCAPGLLKGRDPVICAGCLNLLNVANAALVAAHRLQTGRAYE